MPTPTYSLAPAAPSWLTLDSTTGALSGAPPAGTTSFSYSVIATNDVGIVTAGPFTVALSPGTTSHDADISASLSCPATVPLRTVASCTLTIANAGPAVARFVAAGISLPHRFWRVSATPGARWFGDYGRVVPPDLARGLDRLVQRQLPGLETGAGMGMGGRRVAESRS